LVVSLSVLSGCSGKPKLSVPEEFLQPPLEDELKESLSGVSIVSGGEDEGFRLCTGNEEGCRKLIFGSSGIMESLTDAVDLLSRELGAATVLLAVDSHHASDIPREDLFGDKGSTRVVLQSPSENTDSFVQRLVDEMSALRGGDEPWGAILMTGRAGPAVLRRLGPTGSPGSSAGDAGAIIMELFLPVSGEAVTRAGYPLVGAIGYDLEEARLDFESERDSNEPIHVEMRLFRY
jgi:hypothetical protein